MCAHACMLRLAEAASKEKFSELPLCILQDQYKSKEGQKFLAGLLESTSVCKQSCFMFWRCML